MRIEDEHVRGALESFFNEPRREGIDIVEVIVETLDVSPEDARTVRDELTGAVADHSAVALVYEALARGLIIATRTWQGRRPEFDIG